MNSAKSHPFSGLWIRCIQIYRLSLAINFQHYVKHSGMQSTMKSICLNVISTAIIRILIRIHTVNRAACGHLITFSTTRNWNVLFSLHAEPSSEYLIKNNTPKNFIVNLKNPESDYSSLGMYCLWWHGFEQISILNEIFHAYFISIFIDTFLFSHARLCGITRVWIARHIINP